MRLSLRWVSPLPETLRVASVAGLEISKQIQLCIQCKASLTCGCLISTARAKVAVPSTRATP